MRGFAAPMAVLMGTEEKGTGFFFYAIGEYEESIGFGPKDDGFPAAGVVSSPYQWSQAEDKPTAVAIGPLELAGGEAFHLSEIDCVIPFVVPD
jgi:hypothetical protein